MRAIARFGAVLLLAGAAACEADSHDDLVQAASKLPPQDTLAGSYAPAPSTATDGGVAVPAPANAPPVAGGVAMTGTLPGRQGAPGAAAPGSAAPAANTGAAAAQPGGQNARAPAGAKKK